MVFKFKYLLSLLKTIFKATIMTILHSVFINLSGSFEEFVSKLFNMVQRIQVEHLTVSVVVFVVTVELIALRGKMADVAGRE